MSYALNRTSIGEQIHFNSVSHPKFKHNRLTVSFVLPLAEETASHNAVVPFILRKGYKDCPDFTSLNQKLCDLYGATLDADVSKYAGYQVLEVSIRGLDDRFALEGEAITAQCAELLASVVLDPNVDDGGLFQSSDVELEKQYVIDTIESEINEKRGYAISQCIKLMCQGEPVAIRPYGTVDSAKGITAATATAAYRRMLETAPIEVFFTGSGDPTSAEKIFRQRLGDLKRSAVPYEKIQLRTTADTVREHTENMDITQSKMVLGMRTGRVETMEEVNAMRMFSAVFGGTPFSKLFLNVREKLSLCYYCASRFDVATKLLMVDCGVEAPNKQTAQDEIVRQLKAIQDGDFDDQQLADTKLLVKNTIIATTDSLSDIEGWYLAQILRSQNITPEEDARNMDAVTREQVIAAAHGVTLDTVYFLTSGDQAERKDH